MNYYVVPAVSNTAMGLINPEEGGSPQAYKAFLDGNIEDKEKSYNRLGHVIHAKRLEPHTLRIAPINRPSDAIVEIMDKAMQAMILAGVPTAEISNSSALEEVLWEQIQQAGYQANWKRETRISKVLEQGREYLEFMCECHAMDYTVLTAQEDEQYNRAIQSLDENKSVKAFEHFDNHELIFNEIEVYFEYKGIKCKAKLDRLVIDPVSKQYRVIDYKSTGKSISFFPTFFGKYKYYRQIAWYDLAAQEFMKQKNIVGYTSAGHVIIAVETRGFFLSRVFSVSDEFLELGRKEYDSLVDRILYHTQSGNWVRPQEEEENQGVYRLVPDLDKHLSEDNLNDLDF